MAVSSAVTERLVKGSRVAHHTTSPPQEKDASVFGIIRAWKRRRYARRDLPSEWVSYLEQHVPFFEELSPELRERFLGMLKVFVWEKYFFGAGGLEVTDEIRVVIAATAIRLILHLDISYYNRLTEIVVYPSHYVHSDGDGVILGEAHGWGTVVLSWDAVRQGLKNPNDGLEVGAHEFAHVLDRADGAFDGTPRLRSYGYYEQWGEVLSHHYLKLQKRARAQRKALRSYGATNEAEFFAVATEAFFEKPRKLLEMTPDLYEELKRFYGCDPAAEREGSAGS